MKARNDGVTPQIWGDRMRNRTGRFTSTLMMRPAFAVINGGPRIVAIGASTPIGRGFRHDDGKCVRFCDN
jgi:hypothetical protein